MFKDLRLTKQDLAGVLDHDEMEGLMRAVGRKHRMADGTWDALALIAHTWRYHERQMAEVAEFMPGADL